MKREIRYWTSHPESHPEKWLANFELSAECYRFVYDPVDPDYLFVTEHIYVNDVLRKRFLSLYQSKRILIYYADECIFPDMNVFDYAIAFDRDLKLGDRIARRPPVAFVSELFSQKFPPESLGDISAEMRRKIGFCNFIYSNPDAHPRRDQIFRLLSSYKKVDSLGPHLNNVGNMSSRAAGNWADLLVEMKRPYKFSIACENASYPGYVTEKIVSSFLARTIPIYWGDPGCADEFNPEAFIDASQMSDEELLDVVCRIDSDYNLWRKMLSVPPMTELQYERFVSDLGSYKKFCQNIFDQPVLTAKRAPAGYWPDNYCRWFTSAKGVSYSSRRRLLSHFGRDTECVEGLIHLVQKVMGK